MLCIYIYRERERERKRLLLVKGVLRANVVYCDLRKENTDKQRQPPQWQRRININIIVCGRGRHGSEHQKWVVVEGSSNMQGLCPHESRESRPFSVKHLRATLGFHNLFQREPLSRSLEREGSSVALIPTKASEALCGLSYLSVQRGCRGTRIKTTNLMFTFTCQTHA